MLIGLHVMSGRRSWSTLCRMCKGGITSSQEVHSGCMHLQQHKHANATMLGVSKSCKSTLRNYRAPQPARNDFRCYCQHCKPCPACNPAYPPPKLLFRRFANGSLPSAPFVGARAAPAPADAPTRPAPGPLALAGASSAAATCPPSADSIAPARGCAGSAESAPATCCAAEEGAGGAAGTGASGGRMGNAGAAEGSAPSSAACLAAAAACLIATCDAMPCQSSRNETRVWALRLAEKVW